MKKVFLGGTCNGSDWRDRLIPLLKIDYFNPVVSDWNEESYQKELYERNNCDYCLYVITPKMTGVYSIAEVIDDSNKRPGKTLFCFVTIDDGKTFLTPQLKSLQAVAKMVRNNGGRVFDSYVEIANFLEKENK